ncbi:hypothetical protein EV361DRAFT_875416 [Lentinula raphanica]|nr:hypothetical protein EV361DRAFT_875416 [Lentinula raphanica]
MCIILGGYLYVIHHPMLRDGTWYLRLKGPGVAYRKRTYNDPRRTTLLLLTIQMSSPNLKSHSTQTQPTPSEPLKDTQLNKPDVSTPLAQQILDDETVVGTDESPETESKFKTSVEKLRDAIEGYNTALSQNADEKTLEKHEQNVIQALKEAAENSPNPEIKEYYKAKALEFMKVGRTAKKVLTNDIIKGVLFILASPVALLSSVVVSAGGLVYGLGSVVKGVGDLMSGMTFSGTVLGSKDEPATKKKDAGVQNDGEGREEDVGSDEKQPEENKEDEDGLAVDTAVQEVHEAEGETEGVGGEGEGETAMKTPARADRGLT